MTDSARPTGAIVRPTVFQAPPIPEHFIPRPEVTRALKDQIIGHRQIQSGMLVISAIQGMGGIGKSTLACALANDVEVQARYPFGVLWATLGQNPDLISILTGWIQSLGDYNSKPISVASASSHLRTLLHDKPILIVIDDAWIPSHVEPFLVGGSHSNVLVTTRESTIAKAFRSGHFDLDVMTTDESLALLEKLLGRRLNDAKRSLASALAHEVGQLPLALELAAVQIADGIPWTELLEDLRAEVARLEVLTIDGHDREVDAPSSKRLSLVGSFSLSLRRLSAERLREFSLLGILPEDVEINAAMASTLWGTDERSARKILRYFCDRALIVRNAKCSMEIASYRMHDLIHDMARNLVVTPQNGTQPFGVPGLGVTLQDAHASLLDRYKLTAEGGAWHNLPSDGYIQNHLVWHMEQAGRENEIHVLLREQNERGQNAWYYVREAMDQLAGYISDLNRARDQVRGGGDTSLDPWVIACQFRYLLISTSLQSLADNLSPKLLAFFTSKGIWPGSQSLLLVSLVRDSKKLVNVLSELIPVLEAPLQGHASRAFMKAALATCEEDVLARALPAVAPHLNGPSLRAALGIVRRMRRDDARSRSLAALAPFLSETDSLEAINWIRGKWIQVDPFGSLAALAKRLAALGHPDEALRLLSGVSEEALLSRALPILAPCLDGPGLHAALQFVHQMTSDQTRSESIAALAPFLNETDSLEANNRIRAKWIQVDPFGALAALAKRLAALGHPDEALRLLSGVGGEAVLSRALPILAPYLDGGSLHAALQIVHGMTSVQAKSRSLAALASRLEQPQLLESTEYADQIEQRSTVGELYTALAKRQLEFGWSSNAIKLVCKIKDEFAKVIALEELAPQLDNRGISEALTIAKNLNNGLARSKALAALAEWMPTAEQTTLILRESLRDARAVEDRYARDRLLMSLGTRLQRAGLQTDALAAVRIIESGSMKAKSLIAVGPLLDELLIKEAQDLARTIADKHDQALVLATLAPCLSGLEERRRSLLDALEKCQAIQNDETRIALLSLIIPHVDASEFREAVKPTRAIGDGRLKVETLVTAIVHAKKAGLPLVRAILELVVAEGISPNARNRFVEHLLNEGYVAEALQLVMELGSDDNRDDALTKIIIPHCLAIQAVSTALDAAHAIVGKAQRTTALASLAVNLAMAGHIDLALDTTKEVQDRRDRLEALIEIVPLISASGRRERVLEDVITAATGNAESDFTPLLSRLADRLAKQSYPLEAVKVAGNINHPQTQVDSLVALSRYLTETAMLDALRIIGTIGQDRERDRGLAALIPHVASMGQLTEAVSAASMITDHGSRAQTFTDILPRLQSNEQLDHVLQQLLDAVRLGPHDDSIARSLEGLVKRPIGAGSSLAAIELFRMIKSNGTKGRLIPKIGPWLNGALLENALTFARAMDDDSERDRALTSLVPRAAENGLLTDAFELVGVIRDDVSRKEVLAKLVVSLAGKVDLDEIARHVIDKARQITDQETRDRTMEGLAEWLAESARLPHALEATRLIAGQNAKVRALAIVCQYFKETDGDNDFRLDLLRLVRGYSSANDSPERLKSLVRRLAAGGHLDAALFVVRGIRGDVTQYTVMEDLASKLRSIQLTTEMVADLIVTAKSLRNPEPRARVLMDLCAIPLPAEGSRNMVNETVAAVLAMTDGPAKPRMLGEIAARVETSEFFGLLESVRASGNTRTKAESLLALSAHGTSPKQVDEILVEASAAAQKIESKQGRNQVLAIISLRLAGRGISSEALSALRRMDDDLARANALAALSQFLKLGELAEFVLRQGVIETARASNTAEALALEGGAIGPRAKECRCVAAAIMAAFRIINENVRKPIIESMLLKCDGDTIAYSLASVPVEQWYESADLIRQLVAVLATRFVEHAPYAWHLFLKVHEELPREAVLRNLSIMIPIAKALAGPEAVAEICMVVREVTEWWP